MKELNLEWGGVGEGMGEGFGGWGLNSSLQPGNALYHSIQYFCFEETELEVYLFGKKSC